METRAGAIGLAFATPTARHIIAAPAAAANNSRLVSLLCHRHPQKNVHALLRSRHQHVERRFGQRPAIQSVRADSSRRAVGRGPSGQPQPVERVGRPAFAQEAFGPPPGRVRTSAAAHPAQGRQRHAGGFRIRRRFIAQRAHRRRDSSRLRGTCAPAGTGGLRRCAAGSPPRAGWPSPFRAPGWPASGAHPRRRARRSRATREFLLGQWRDAQQPLRAPIGPGGFLPRRAQQPVDGARMRRAPGAPREAAPPAPSPSAFVDAGLRRPAAVPRCAARSQRKPAARRFRLRPPPAAPGRRRPSARSTRLRGGRANRHPRFCLLDQQVRSTSNTAAGVRLPDCPLYAS